MLVVDICHLFGRSVTSTCCSHLTFSCFLVSHRAAVQCHTVTVYPSGLRATLTNAELSFSVHTVVQRQVLGNLAKQTRDGSSDSRICNILDVNVPVNARHLFHAVLFIFCLS